MGRPKRIVFLDNFPRVGGAEMNLLDLLARLDRDWFEPLFIASAEGELTRGVSKLGIPFEICPLPERVSEVSRTALRSSLGIDAGLQLLAYLMRLRQMLRKLQPKLIYTNTMKDHVASALLAPTLRKPVVWHFMDFIENPLLRRMLERLVEWNPIRVIPNSRFTASQFRRLVRSPQKVRVIYEGVDFKEIDRRRRSEPAAPLPERNGPVVGILGALCPPKGQELLIRAVALLSSQLPGLSCWIVGDEFYTTSRHRRGYRQYLENLARELGVADRVHFLGWRSDVVEVIERLDLMVCASDPSLAVETFGRTLVEAMACGKPVVSIAYGGPRETVIDGVTGVLFERYEAGILADVIGGVVSDEVWCREMGEAGRRRAEEFFAVESFVRGVQTEFHDILGTLER